MSYNTSNCSCCNKKFSYIVNSTLVLRRNRIKSVYEFPEHLKEKIDNRLKSICLDCYCKYLDQPHLLIFEIELGLLI